MAVKDFIPIIFLALIFIGGVAGLAKGGGVWSFVGCCVGAALGWAIHHRFVKEAGSKSSETPNEEKETPSGSCAQKNADGCCGAEKKDCNQECGGTAVMTDCGCGKPAPDDKGCCPDDQIPEGECDCRGTKIPVGECDCEGTKAVDGCCDGATAASGYCDCAGTMKVDGCCNGEIKDCNEECGGSAVMMDCGCNLPLNEHGCCNGETKDCNDECGGTAVDLGCGCGNALSLESCDGTCTGERPGMIYMDKCVCEYTKAGATAPIAYANAKTGEIVEMIAKDAGDLVGMQCDETTACPASWTLGETEFTPAWDKSTPYQQCEWNEDCVGEITENYECRSPPAPSS